MMNNLNFLLQFPGYASEAKDTNESKTKRLIKKFESSKGQQNLYKTYSVPTLANSSHLSTNLRRPLTFYNRIEKETENQLKPSQYRINKKVKEMRLEKQEMIGNNVNHINDTEKNNNKIDKLLEKEENKSGKSETGTIETKNLLTNYALKHTNNDLVKARSKYATLSAKTHAEAINTKSIQDYNFGCSSENQPAEKASEVSRDAEKRKDRRNENHPSTNKPNAKEPRNSTQNYIDKSHSQTNTNKPVARALHNNAQSYTDKSHSQASANKPNATNLLNKAEGCILKGNLDDARTNLIQSWQLKTNQRTTSIYKSYLEAGLTGKLIKYSTNDIESDKLVILALDKYKEKKFDEAKKLVNEALERHTSFLYRLFMKTIEDNLKK